MRLQQYLLLHKCNMCENEHMAMQQVTVYFQFELSLNVRLLFTCDGFCNLCTDGRTLSLGA